MADIVVGLVKVAAHLLAGIGSFVSNMGSGPSISQIGVGVGPLAEHTLHAAEKVAESTAEFANAAAHPISQTGLPIIQSLGSHSRLIEHMNLISSNVVDNTTAANVNSFMEQLAWFNFWTGYNPSFSFPHSYTEVEGEREAMRERTETTPTRPPLKPANLSALQDKDLAVELKRNQDLVANFQSARNTLLANKQLVSPEQLNTANQQIMVIVRDAERRNQEIMAELEKRRAATAKPVTDRGQRVINAAWGDRTRLNATREDIKIQNERARQRVLETHDREARSETAHAEPLLPGYKVAASHEKTPQLKQEQGIEPKPLSQEHEGSKRPKSH